MAQQIREPVLIIKDWPKGIGESPHAGLALMQNVEIGSFPGAVRSGKKPKTAFHATYTSTFTADSATDIMTSSATVPNTSTAVTVSNSGGALPTGLAASTNYFVIKISDTTFKLATTIANAVAGTAIDITGNGSGTNTVTTVDPGTITHQVRDPRNSNIFAIDSNGRVWYDASSSGLFLLLNGNTTTNASGNGLVLFRTSDGSATFLFAFRNASIDVVNVFGTSDVRAPSWNNAWQSMNTGAGVSNSHHSILGQDNIIYFCDDKYIGSIKENAGSVFDPTNAATYTYTNQALDLPNGLLTYWLEQLDVNLLISVSNDWYIYPWDRSSDSFGIPIPIGEFGGNKMVNIGNIVYVLAGTRGNVYWTQGTYVRLLKTLPQYLLNNSTTPVSTYLTWGGIGNMNGKLLVGVGAASGKSGVYMIDVQGGLLGAAASGFTIDNYPSTGQANVTSIYSNNEFYRMGYAGGADYFDGTRYTNKESIIQSGLYRIGNKTQKSKVSEIEVQIANAIAGTIRIGYRRDAISAFTTIITFTTNGTDTSYQQDFALIDIENLELQAEYDHGIDILEVRLWP